MAVLSDGDNADAGLIEHILNEVAKFGRVTIKRIYADWTGVVNKYDDFCK